MRNESNFLSKQDEEQEHKVEIEKRERKQERKVNFPAIFSKALLGSTTE